MRQLFSSRLCASLALAALCVAPLSAQGQGGHWFGRRPVRFEPIASFGVPGGIAEIVAATADGRTLAYTDAGSSRVGIVDIQDPRTPMQLATVSVSGEPTSVAIVGDLAFVAVWADLPSEGSPPPAFLPGQLLVLDLANPAAPVTLASHPIGYQPDSVKAVRRGGEIVVVVAIENQPVVVENGLVTDEEAPGSPNDQSPNGFVQVLRINRQDGSLLGSASVTFDPMQMAAAGLLYPADAQPEFVDIHGDLAAVSLQENNGIALIDLSDAANPTVQRIFSTGIAGDRPADLVEDDAIDFSNRYPSDIGTANFPASVDAGGNIVPGGSRMVDAIAFSPDGRRIYAADEGEFNYTGGRGVSGFDLNGTLRFEDRELERLAVQIGQYPEGRSENKGLEMEGVATGTFDGTDFAFFLSERGSFMAVYELPRWFGRPRLVQTVPTGVSPEGVVVIEDRGLVITADEESGTLSIFEATRRPSLPSRERPQLFGFNLNRPFSAISGLAPAGFGDAFAVPDNAVPTAIYRIGLGASLAPVSTVLPVRINGVQARYDGEGLAVDTSILSPRRHGRGFWIASEGNANSQPNLLVQIDARGEVLREIQMPNAIDAAADASLPGTATASAAGGRIRSNGFEGVTISEDGRYLLAAIQREFSGEFGSGQKFVRIARYDLQQLEGPNAASLSSGLRTGGDWEFFYLPLDPAVTPGSWVGLSEIITIGDGQYAVIERDNQLGTDSHIKKVYAFSLRGLTADADGLPDASDTATKVEVRNLLQDFFPYEKIEGLAIIRGDLWVSLDNDGGEVEPRVLNTGRFVNPLGL